MLKSQPFVEAIANVTSKMSHLTFEQQKELLLIEAVSKEKILEAQSRLELSKVQLQQQQLDLESYHLDLIKDRRISATNGSGNEDDLRKFNVVSNLRLILQFVEKDVECFFVLFECVTEARN